MKKIFLLMFLSFYLHANNMEIGILVKKFNNNNYLNLVIKVIERNFDSTKSKLNIKVYTKKNLILKDLKDSKLKGIIINPFTYFANKNIIDKYTNERWSLKFNKQEIEEYYLIANAKENNIMKNISKYKIITLDGLENSYIWYKYIYFKNKHKRTNENKHLFETKENKIIYSVFFNKNRLAIVTKVAYDVISELNPQLKKGIKIIKKSPAIFISFLGFNHISMSEEEKNTLYNVSKEINKFLGNSQLASSSKIGISKSFTHKKLNKLESFYKKYKIIEDKYK
ncbi:MAG: hypothetical protein MJK08_01685 [Campylobacterales bacterium]|nr:hypothetical protein [Campylobacterales bacterium]